MNVSLGNIFACNIVVFQRLGIKKNLHGEHAVLRRIHSLFQVVFNKIVPYTKWDKYMYNNKFTIIKVCTVVLT